MRAWIGNTVLAMAVSAAVPAAARPLLIPDEKPVFHDTALSDTPQPFTSPQPNMPLLVERPVGEVLATKLGFADGSAELFRYRVENAPSQKTVLDGVVDGGGIKLKLSW